MTPDIFDPAHYAKVRLPPLQAETLPAWCYTSEEFYRGEVERMFRRSWNFIGRADELPNPGDYMALDLFGEAIIVIRDRAGKLNAFANTCRHRGTKLLEGQGRCTAIVCPYHNWAYTLSGELFSAVGMEQTENFDKRQYGLIPVRLESWGGFLFASFDPAAPSLGDYLGDLPERLQSYGLEDMICVRRREYQLACNWKLYLENAMEEYHTPTVHKLSIGAQVTRRETTRGAWDGMFMPAEKTIAVLGEDIASAFPPIPGLDAKAAGGTYFVVIYPMTFFAFTQDCCWWLQQFPAGATRTRVVIGSCFPRATVARPDFAERVAKYYRRWDKSLPEDNAISERQQAGITSSFARPGRLSHQELLVHGIANWMLDRVIG
ncbi:MAG TPA: aromatic ring-hydroxylating dioxygenase subunit alpha [Stellaceae bacterium]|nr:aromatic ring-hydroxylating dioxygenase subunit alpha [Stellaceae bacterium]